jgi:hypothetical protein
VVAVKVKGNNKKDAQLGIHMKKNNTNSKKTFMVTEIIQKLSMVGDLLGSREGSYICPCPLLLRMPGQRLHINILINLFSLPVQNRERTDEDLNVKD